MKKVKLLNDELLSPIEDKRSTVESVTECSLIPEKKFDLVDKLDCDDLEALKAYFFPSGKNFSRILFEMELYYIGTTPQASRGIPLTKDAFVSSVKEVIGTPAYESAAADLFDKLQSKNILQNNVIWWDQLLDTIMEVEQSRKASEKDETYKFKEKEGVNVSHCKSEIVKILLPETPHSSCYIIISSLGKVGVYNYKLNIQESYNIPMGSYTSSRSCWINDAYYAPDASCMFVSSSNRKIFVYNISQLFHKLQFSIEGVPNSPVCLHYASLSSEKKSLLFIGDDRGNIISINFLQPHKSFFRQKRLKQEESYNWIVGSSDNYFLNSKYFLKDILKQEEYAVISINKKVHNGEVSEIFYIEENDSVASCSKDPLTSIVIRERKGKRAPYLIKLEKGVRHFHISKKLCLLATTNTDHFILLWNLVQMFKAIKILKGHKEPVVDVRILKHVLSILSLSEKSVLKVWSLETYACLQTIHLSFNFTGQSSESNKIYPGLKQFPQSVSKAYSTFQALHAHANLEWDGPDCQSDSRDMWMRAEFIVTCFNQIKLVEVDTKIALEFNPLPLPRRTLEPALPTPYYPLTHTFRENTKMLKQRMFKNLAGLAPFYDLENAVATFKYKCMQDTKELQRFVREGIPHFGVTLSAIKPLNVPTNLTKEK